MGLLDTLSRYAEPVAVLGTGMLAEPVSGWAGLLSGNAGNVHAVRDAMTYQPRTESGKQGMANMQELLGLIKTNMVDNNPPVQIPVEAYERAADYWGERSPLAGAAMKTLPAAATTFMAPGSQPIRKAFGSVGRETGSFLRDVGNINVLPSQGAARQVANQRGYINLFDNKGNPIGKAPENSREVMTMANRLDKLLSDAGVPYERDMSGIGGNGSQYFRIEKPQGFTGGDYDTFNMRIADHPEKYGGNDVYVDPRNQSFEQALKQAKEMYPNIKNKVDSNKLPPRLKWMENKPEFMEKYPRAIERVKEKGDYKPKDGNAYADAIAWEIQLMREFPDRFK